jgi:hypothetical protein
MLWFCLAFWWRDSNVYLVFSAFTSRPTFLLASIRLSERAAITFPKTPVLHGGTSHFSFSCHVTGRGDFLSHCLVPEIPGRRRQAGRTHKASIFLVIVFRLLTHARREAGVRPPTELNLNPYWYRGGQWREVIFDGDLPNRYKRRWTCMTSALCWSQRNASAIRCVGTSVWMWVSVWGDGRWSWRVGNWVSVRGDGRWSWRVGNWVS